MNRYPHQIVIYKSVTSKNPYEEDSWEEVYIGRCRCANDGRYKNGAPAHNDYVAYIPDPTMPDIPEGSKVGVKMHKTDNDKDFDIIGFVNDHMPYERVRKIYFSVIKDAQLESDTEILEE